MDKQQNEEQELNEQIVNPTEETIEEKAIEAQEAPTEEPKEEVADAPVVEEAPAEEPKVEETEQVEITEASDDKEEDRVEVAQEPPVEEERQDVVEEPPVQSEDEVEKLKSELAEKEAIIEEANDVKAFENDEAEAQAQYKDFLEKLGGTLAAEFRRYGIDPSKTIEELEKEDPTKAQVARNLIQQAQNVKQQAQTNLTNNLNERFRQLVFKKASRLFDAFKMNEKEMDVAAETFVSILTEAGIKDLDDDLKAKVELAVARARMIAPKVKDAGKQVKEIVDDVNKAIVDVAHETAKSEKEEGKKDEEPAKEEKVEEQHQEPPKPVEEKATIEDFKEGINGKPSASSSINADNVQQKLAEIKDPRERVKFYLENFALLEEAGKKSLAKEIKNS